MVCSTFLFLLVALSSTLKVVLWSMLMVLSTFLSLFVSLSPVLYEGDGLLAVPGRSVAVEHLTEGDVVEGLLLVLQAHRLSLNISKYE